MTSEQATADSDVERRGFDGFDASLDLDTCDGHAHRVADLRGALD